MSPYGYAEEYVKKTILAFENISKNAIFQVIGNCTSGCYSPTLGKGLVFAYIPSMCDVPGTEVQVEVMGELRKAKVLDGPPVLTQPARDAKSKK